MAVFNFLKRSYYNIRNLNFGLLLIATLTIILAVFGIYEIIEFHNYFDFSPHNIHYLFVTRGLMIAALLFVWAIWVVYQFKMQFTSELAITENRYRDIVENSADAIITIGLDNHIQSWNNGAEKIFGWTLDEMINTPIGKMIPENLIKAGELLCLAYGIDHHGYVKNYQTERKKSTGQVIPVNITETVLKRGNTILGRSQIIRDISEINRIQHNMRMDDRLITAGNLAAGVAHEIGNPLTAISSLVQLMMRKTDNDLQKQQLLRIRANIERISTIVHELVDFTRPQISNVSYMHINEVIQNAVGLLRYDNRSRSVELELNLAHDLPKILASPDKLHQVFVNLLVNAYDAMVHKGNLIKITTFKQSNRIIILVEDNGEGMENHVMDNIFEPFFTTKEIGKGTGLGLSVSHGIINNLGGNISVTSSKENGTTFKIQLPMENQ